MGTCKSNYNTITTMMVTVSCCYSNIKYYGTGNNIECNGKNKIQNIYLLLNLFAKVIDVTF